MIIFAVLQFINVILGSLRSLATAKGGKHLAAMLNVISFTFYAAVVKMTGQQQMWFVLTITALTNLFGYYLADYIFNRIQKDRIWKITVEPLLNSIVKNVSQALIEKDITFTTLETDDSCPVLEIYSYSQRDSSKIKKILYTYINEPKYFITENANSL